MGSSRFIFIHKLSCITIVSILIFLIVGVFFPLISISMTKYSIELSCKWTWTKQTRGERHERLYKFPAFVFPTRETIQWGASLKKWGFHTSHLSLVLTLMPIMCSYQTNIMTGAKSVQVRKDSFLGPRLVVGCCVSLWWIYLVEA